MTKTFKFDQSRLATLGATFAFLLGSIAALPNATADIEDIVQNLDQANREKPGEIVGVACDSAASNLDKPGRFTYDLATGGSKYETSTAESAD